MTATHVQKWTRKSIFPNSKITPIRAYSLLLLSMVYLFYILTGWIGEFIVLAVTFFVFAVSLPFMNRLPQIMSVVMLGLGNILYVVFDADASYWTAAILQNVPFVTLFVFMPLLSIPIRVGGYVEFIGVIMRRFGHRPLLVHSIVAASTFVITSFMNIGSVRIMNDLFADSFKENRERLVKAIMQGFSLSAMFSPYIAGVAVVLYLLNVPLLSFLMYGIILVLLGLSLSVGVSYIQSIITIKRGGIIKDPLPISIEALNHAKIHYRKGIELLAAFIGLFTSFILLDKILHINFVTIVSLIAIVFPLVWVAVLGRAKLLPTQLSHYRRVVLPNVHNESIMIITATFFAKMVQLSTLPYYLSRSLSYITDYSLLLGILAILLSILILGLIGVHQVLPITIYAASFSPIEMGMAPVLLASVLAIGWGVGGLIAHVSSLNIVSGNLFGFSWFKLSKWNIPFVISFIFIAAIFIYCMNLLIS